MDTGAGTRALFFMVFLATLFSGAAQAEIPSSLEPVYAEAVLAYHSNKPDRALSLLSQLLQKSPDSPEFLELQALCLKAANNDAKAADVYTHLIGLKKSPSERGPYRFELGSLRFKS